MALQTKDYSVTQKSSGGGITYTYILRVTENSTNTEKNTSNITVQAILKQSYIGTAFTTWYTGVSCTLNGSQIFSDYKQRSLSGTAETIYYTWTGNIAHNDDGSLSLTVGGKIWQSTYASYSPPAMTIEESASNAMVLTAIPRASSISASDADIGSTATVILGSNSTGFTHTIAYKFGSLSGYIGTDGNLTAAAVKLSSTTIGFKLPISFYAQIPNAKYGICTLTCQTYSGSTAIGDAQTCTFKAKAVQEECAPQVRGTAADTNEATLALTGNDQVLVRYMSKVECSIEVTLRNQAGSVKQKKIGGAAVTGESYTIEQPQSGSMLFEAIDSRGYPGSDTVTLDLIPYVILTNNASVKRTDPTSGNAVLTIEKGEYFKGSFGAADNTLHVKYRIGDGEYVEVEPVIGDAGGYSASANITGLEYQSTHTIEVVVEDALMTVTKTVTVSKGIPVFDWGERDFSFNVPVKFNAGIGGGNTAGLVAYPVGSIYMSVNATSPAEIFGGVWERLKDRFLLAAGDTYVPGSTGGEAEHVLKVEEMPKHNHAAGGVNTTAPQNGSSAMRSYDYSNLTGEESIVSTTGGDQPHNNMPPYLAVYMWKRIA